MKKLLLIVNPVTARAVMTPHLIDVIDTFEKNGYDVTVHISKRKGDVSEITEEQGSFYDTVVSCGGDGTLNETISGVLKLDKRPKIGYIPSGTTNDFATSWGIPKKPMEAAECIVTREAKKTDISTMCGRPYVYVSAFGAFTEASYSTPQEMKKSLGWAAYIIEGIKSLPTIRPISMRIEYDGGVEEGEFLYGMFSNTRRVGGFDLKLKQEISLSDGLMEVILVKAPKNNGDNAKLLNALLTQDFNSEFVVFRQTHAVRFSSRDEVYWTIDGENGGDIREGEITTLDGAVELFY